MTSIRKSIENAIEYLTGHPEAARYTDSIARATLGDSLRVEVVGPGGERTVTDMPSGVGGLAEHPSPGWLYRAAVASCVASTVAMEAAREGITLTSLEVEVDSESDDRGILGMDPDTPVGPFSLNVRIRAATEEGDGPQVRSTIQRGADRCPVCDATKRAVSVSVEIAVG